MDCKYCGTPLPTVGSSYREYCSNAHRQAYWRKCHPPVIPMEVRRELADLRMRNAILEEELARLRKQTP